MNAQRAPSPCVLACGAWLKNTACLLDGGAPRWSPLHGDLGDPDACRRLDESLRRLARDAARPVTALAHDLHPDFFSTRIAQALAAEWDVPAVGVQHHHAHIGVVMADHGLEEPVIGLALDGVGLGTDGTAWGGELLWVAPGAWRRLGHLWPLALPGGDVAAREPWRMAASALHGLGRGDEIVARFGPVVGEATARGVQRMLAGGLNCPVTSSAGRWFDAAAGALGLSVRQDHEAQAAIALERQAVLAGDGEHGPRAGVGWSGSGRRLDLRPLLSSLFDWPEAARHRPEAAAWFHHAFADALADWAADAAREAGVRTVCLGGGCFLNRVLTARLSRRLEAHGLRVLLPGVTHVGDAGLALGQAWVAARQADGPSPSTLAIESATCA